MRPSVGRRPVTPQRADGPRIEPLVSVPIENATRPAAVADPGPADDPPDPWVVSHGLYVAGDPQLLATDLADYLVRKGLPFRQAHHAVGAVVALAEQTGKSLDRLSVAEYQSISPDFGSDILKMFDLGQAMNRRRIIGAPGTKEVRRELAAWQKQLQKS